MSPARPRHVEIFPSGEIGIAWDDGTEDFFPARDLRLACPCAQCVDEMTGRRTLDPARVPQNLKATGWEPVGSYALFFRWTDAHQSGIYSFELLRELAGRR